MAAKSDWSKISTDDLIAIYEAFERAVENTDGTWSIHLNDVIWSRCLEVRYEIAHELLDRDKPA